jgi:hypothetical protein
LSSIVSSVSSTGAPPDGVLMFLRRMRPSRGCSTSAVRIRGIALRLQEAVDIQHGHEHDGEIVGEILADTVVLRALDEHLEHRRQHLGTLPFAGVYAAVDEHRGLGSAVDRLRVRIAKHVSPDVATGGRLPDDDAVDRVALGHEELVLRVQAVVAAEAVDGRERVDRYGDGIAERDVVAAVVVLRVGEDHAAAARVEGIRDLEVGIEDARGARAGTEQQAGGERDAARAHRSASARSSAARIRIGGEPRQLRARRRAGVEPEREDAAARERHIRLLEHPGAQICGNPFVVRGSERRGGRARALRVSEGVEEEVACA